MRGLRVLTAMAATGVIGAAGIASAGAAVLAHHSAPAAAATMSAGVCPTGLLSLPPAGVQHAATQALSAAARLYKGINTKGAEVMAADRSAFGGDRGREVSTLCGRKVAARTVVVQMLFPRMLPSASLSEAVVFVGRFARGYRVWYIAH